MGTDVWDLTPWVLSWIRLKVAVIISSGCMTPEVRSLDGVARALLRAGLKPCMLHEALQDERTAGSAKEFLCL